MTPAILLAAAVLGAAQSPSPLFLWGISGRGESCIPASSRYCVDCYSGKSCVFQLYYRLCATDAYTDGKDRTKCSWQDAPPPWVYPTLDVCNKAGVKELSVNYGDWRTLEHKRLRAVEYRCRILMIEPKP